MKGIHVYFCTLRIYLKEGFHPIWKPQRRMNPNLRDIFKEELKKLLNENFIYPFSSIQWVSPLFFVSKKNGKWRIFVDYRKLNKSIQKDHFPLPFIPFVVKCFFISR